MTDWGRKLRDFVFAWSVLIASITWVWQVIENGCAECIKVYFVEIAIFSVTLLTIVIFSILNFRRVNLLDEKINGQLDELNKTILKSDIDRFYNQHKDVDSLSEDSLKYVYMLQEKLNDNGVNSFSQRKVTELLNKEIKNNDT